MGGVHFFLTTSRVPLYPANVPKRRNVANSTKLVTTRPPGFTARISAEINSGELGRLGFILKTKAQSTGASALSTQPSSVPSNT